MSYTSGAVKYIVKGPFTNPVAFFIYGSGILALLNAVFATSSGRFVEVFLAYYTTKYLPPTSLADLVLPIILGSIVAGIKWWLTTPRW